MAGDNILFQLQTDPQPISSKLVKELDTYLTHAPDGVYVRNASNNAIRFLYAINNNFDKVVSTSSTNTHCPLVEFLTLCYDFLLQHPASIVKDPYTSEKVLYQILTKMSKKDPSSFHLNKSILESVLKRTISMDTTDMKERHNIASVYFYVLWNVTLGTGLTSPKHIINLSVLTLQFLLLSDKTLDNMMEKFNYCFDKMTQHRKTEKTLLAKTALEFCDQVWILTSSMENFNRVCCITSTFLHCSKILLLNGEKWSLPVELEKLMKEAGQKDFIPISVLDIYRKSFLLLPKIYNETDCVKLLKDHHAELLSFLQSVNSTSKSKKIKEIHICAAQTIGFCLFLMTSKLKEMVANKNGSKGKNLTFRMDELEVIFGVFLAGAQAMNQECQIRKSRLTAEDKVSTNRIVFLCIEEIRMRHEYITAMLNVLTSQKSPDTPESTRLLSWACEELKEVEVAISDAKAFKCSKPVSPDEHISLATLAYRFAKHFYQKSHFAIVERFINVSLSQFKEWSKHVTQKQIEKQLVGRKVEIGATSLRKVKMLDRALALTADAVFLDHSYCNMGAELWLKIQDDIQKAQEGQKMSTLYDTLVKRTDVEDAYLQQILEAEMKAVKTTKAVPGEYYTRLKEIYLSKYAKGIEDRAYIMTEEVQFLWTRREDSDQPANCCQQVIDMLEDELKEDKLERKTVIEDLLARAYLMLYVVKSVDPVEMMQENGEESSEQPTSRPSSPVSGIAEADMYGKCYSVDQELSAIAFLERALELWEATVEREEACAMRYKCVRSTLESLSVLLGAFRLVGRFCQVIKTIRLIRCLHKLDTSSSQVHVIQAQTQLLQLASEWAQPELAKVCCEETDQWLDKIQFDKKKNYMQYTMYMVAKAECLLMQNQIEEGQNVLKVVEKLNEDNSNSKDARIAEYALSSTFSQYLLIPPRDEDFDDDKSALESRVQAARSIGGVISFLLGEWVVRDVKKDRIEKVPSNLLEKWQLLDMVLNQLLNTGYLFTSLGDARESQCYLQQGIKISKTFMLPKRLAQFHLALAQQDYLSEKENDCAAHINAARYLLISDLAMDKLDSNLSPSSQQDLFSPTSPPEPMQEGDFVIQTKPLDLDEEEELMEQKPKGAESPTRTKRHIFKAPAWWNHDIECECPSCEDIMLSSLTLQHTVFHSQLCYLNKDTQAVHELLKELLTNFDHWTNKTISVLSSVLACLSPLQSPKEDTEMVKKTQDKSKQCQKVNKVSGPIEVYRDDGQQQKSVYNKIGIKPFMYQELLVTVGLQMMRLAVEENDEDSYNEWSDKIADLINLEENPHMLLSYHTALAQLLYLQIVHDGHLSSEESKDGLPSSIEDLCNDMKTMQVRDNFDPVKIASISCGTPDVTHHRSRSKSPSAVNAPARAKLHRLQKTSTSNLTVESTITSVAGTERQRKTATQSQSNSPRKSVESVSPRSTSPNSNETKNLKTYSMKEFLTQTKKSVSESKIPGSLKSKRTNSRSKSQSQKVVPPKIQIWEDQPNDIQGSDDVFKTPAKPQKSKIAPFVTPRTTTSISATPKSVSSRKAALDLLLDSDSDDDNLLLPKPTRGRKASAQKTTLQPKLTSGRKASSSTAKSQPLAETVKKQFDMESNGITPSKKLFRINSAPKSANENEENVFDFGACSDEDIPLPMSSVKSKSKKPPSGVKKTRTTRAK